MTTDVVRFDRHLAVKVILGPILGAKNREKLADGATKTKNVDETQA